MRRTLVAALLVLAALGSLRPAAQADDEHGAVVLEEDRSLAIRMGADQQRWVGRIDVPRDATRLGVVLNAGRDADLYLKRGEPAGGDLFATADARSATPAPHEAIVLSPLGEVELRPGPWYVTVSRPWPEDQPLLVRISVFIDRQEGRPSLLPGSSTLLTLPADGRGVRVRTYVPFEALRALIETGEEAESRIRFSYEGEDGLLREGVIEDHLVLTPPDVPSQPFLLTLRAAEGREEAQAVRLSIAWTFAHGVRVPPPEDLVMALGSVRRIALGGPDAPAERRLRIPVADAVVGFVLEARNELGVDVDLFVKRGAPPQREDVDADWFATSTDVDERLVVGGKTPLEPGTYFVVVSLIEDTVPAEVLLTTEVLPPGGDVHTWGEDMPPLLEEDTWRRGRVRVARSSVAWHTVDVPAGTRTLHAQVLEATGPLELVLVRGTDGSVLARSFSPLVDERLVVNFPAPLAGARRFVLGVFNRSAWTQEEVSYRVAVGYGDPPPLPEDLPWPPRLEGEDLTPLERAAAATVEITIDDCSGGSGICVNPRGWVLTCRHCLRCAQGFSALQRDGILVAFTRRLDEPPVQAFYARVHAEDEDRDVVLLEPVHDVFGRPLPERGVFPWLPMGDSEALRLGDPLWALGYPADGSDRGRTPVVVSRGVYAGSERRGDRPPWFKTDAWIAPGHSGGPLVDAQGLLVGVSSATLGTTESLGIGVPIENLPSAWMRRIRQGGAR